MFVSLIQLSTESNCHFIYVLDDDDLKINLDQPMTLNPFDAVTAI